MDMKQVMGDARKGLNVSLRDWTTPSSKLLPVDPAYASSCLKIALRHGQAELAQAAAKTLAVFAPDLLWKSLLTFAASETASFDLHPTLAIMAAKRDQAWIRRKGGLARVASYLVCLLLQAPRSLDATRLWRLSFNDPDSVATPLKRLATDARILRHGMLGLLGYEAGASEPSRQLLNNLAQCPETRVSAEICISAFRQVLAPPSLMQLLLRDQLEVAGKPSRLEAHKVSVYEVPSARNELASIAATLRLDSSAGRKSIREIISAIPDLDRELSSHGLAQEDAMEVVVDLLQRQDEDENQNVSILIKGLGEASRWSGVGIVDQRTAKSIDAVIRANAPAVAAIRSSHIPTPLAGNF